MLHPSGWSLRAKIAVVLLLPVLVALTLGGARIRAELDEASRLSAVRDQLPVLRGTTELTALVDEEMVSAVAGRADVTTRQTAVDAKASTVVRAADFAELAPELNRKLSAAVGSLNGLRAAGGRDPIAQTAGYRDVLDTLSDVVLDLDGSADTVKSLVQLRSGIAIEEALLFSAGTDEISQAVIVATHRVAAEEAVLGEQLRRGLANPVLASATSSAATRRNVLESALTSERSDDLRGLLPTMRAESVALNGLIGGNLDAISGDVIAQTNGARSAALRDAAVVLGALLAALTVALLVARSLVSPVRRLHAAALDAAHNRLPATIERVRGGEDVDWRAIDPVPVQTGEEIGQLARAFDDMHRRAVLLAGEQAVLRRQVSEMFMTLARRSQSLVELQLSVIEGLEAQERDPQRLQVLFQLDHLATRLRRNGENLQVLAGGSPARPDLGPITMVELLRAATSEVKDYRRIGLGHAPAGSVRADAAADVVHILAELLENATRFSPPEKKVILTADRGADGGLLVEVVDYGLGMAAEDVEAANRRFTTRADVGPETTRRMGLFVVGRLAVRHGVAVRLRSTVTGREKRGITASVHVPGELVVTEGEYRENVAQPGEMTTPIFDQVVSRWFTKAPADQGWQAAEVAVQAPARTTAAGLPVREAGRRLVPGAAAAAPAKAEKPLRDPVAIRNSLSRHYDGMSAARRRTQGEERP